MDFDFARNAYNHGCHNKKSECLTEVLIQNNPYLVTIKVFFETVCAKFATSSWAVSWRLIQCVIRPSNLIRLGIWHIGHDADANAGPDFIFVEMAQIDNHL